MTTFYGSNVELTILKAQNLPRTDIFGHCDPYLWLTVGDTIKYKTNVIYNTGNPEWNEEVWFSNVPEGTLFSFHVFDKDIIKAHDFIGKAEFNFNALSNAFGPPHLSNVYNLDLVNPKLKQNIGSIQIVLKWTGINTPMGPMVHSGPVRFRVALSNVAGALTGAGNDCWMGYAAYKVTLTGIRLFFPDGATQHWNTKYAKAKQIFSSGALMGAIRTQHAMLYADDGSVANRGLLRGQKDLLELLHSGMRGGQRKYYTYVILEDSMRFSETGAAFFQDFMSKHAMHSNCAENVVYSGEFCLIPEPDSEGPGRHRLVIDNNSGTYAPDASLLPALRDLMFYNFPDLPVETISAADPVLKHYHELVPSRVDSRK